MKIVKKIQIAFGILLGLIVLIGGVCVYSLYTEQGSRWLTQAIIKFSFKEAKINFASMKGSFARGFELRQLELSDDQRLPAGSVLRVQELILLSPIWQMQKAKLVIVNARVILPQSDTVVLDGTYDQGQANFSLYTNSVSLEQIKKIFNIAGIPRSLSGSIKKIDLKISGTIEELVIKGNLLIESGVYQEIVLIDSPIVLDLKLRKKFGGYQPFGTIILEAGALSAKNIKVDLDKSTFFLAGDIANPSLYLEGHAKVENTDIHILLTGTKDKPQLKLSSGGGESQERLLLMLATGKSWKGLDSSFENKQVSPELVKDAINYFMFPGSGDTLAKKMGIKSFSVTFEDNKKGIGFKKQVTNQVDVGYAVEETQLSPDEKVRQHTVSSDVGITEKLSVSIEKELRGPDQKEGATNPEDNKVFLKYKTSF